MSDSPTTLFDALPRNVVELAKEAISPVHDAGFQDKVDRQEDQRKTDDIA